MAETYRTNLPRIAATYIQALGVPVTKSTLKKSLEENPFFPSLYSLSNTLDRFHIAHTACRVEKEKLDELTTPFIAYMDKQSTGKDFVTVTTVNSAMVTFIAGSRKPQKISREEFVTNWQGIVLQAQPDAKSGESDYVGQKKSGKNQHLQKKCIACSSHSCNVLCHMDVPECFAIIFRVERFCFITHQADRPGGSSFVARL